MQTKQRFSRMAMFVAVAMIFSYIEFLLPIPLPFPGVKLGLANLVIIIPLYLWGFAPAMGISLLRIVLVGITFGNMATMMYSLAGGILSLTVMFLAQRIRVISPVGVSIIGGVFHNIGQLVVAMLVIESSKLILYFPVLLVSGGVTGFLIGILAVQVLQRLGAGKNNGKKYSN